MIEITVTNRKLYFEGLDRTLVRELNELCSYLVEGYFFSPAFKAHRWDGREALFRFSNSKGYNCPSGLLVPVCRRLKKLRARYRVIDETEVRGERRPLAFSGSLRDYQVEAVKAILSPPWRGRGILKLPIRSGKTRVGGRILAALGLPSLFLVPSKGLLHQTREALSELLPGASIGLLGDGLWEPERITVATLQTVARLKGSKGREPGSRQRWSGREKSQPTTTPRSGSRPCDRYRDIRDGFDVVICDEVHHIRGGGEWHKVLQDIDARYKIGLSATAFLKSTVEQSRGAIWMLATCGEVRMDVPVSRLVADGYLMRQNVHLYRVTEPTKYRQSKWSATMFRKCVIENEHRNRLIARVAAEHVAADLKVLVIAKRLDHIALLHEALEDEELRVGKVVGKTSTADRKWAVESLEDGTLDVLLGNVLGEGMDLPCVNVVINAEGGKDDKVTIQRQRNLTVSEGKTQAIFVDFMDETNVTLLEHSEARRAMYESESQFIVEVIE